MKMTFAVVVMVMTVKSQKCSCFWKRRSEIRFHIPILHHYDIFPPGGNLTGGNMLVWCDVMMRIMATTKTK